MVFFEGLDKTGKTTLYRALATWRRDQFSYFDRGPWSRCALGGYYGLQPGIAAAAGLAARAAPWAIVVYVHRDFETLVALQRHEERFSRAQLEEQERLFEDAFLRLPPAHLVHVHNGPDTSLASLIQDVRGRLDEIASRSALDRAESADRPG